MMDRTYFTEVEDHFRRARNSPLHSLSPRDWTLLEGWRDAGVPLDAVLKGIDSAFRKYHAGRRRFSTINSLSYCAHEVAAAARAMAARGPAPPAAESPEWDDAALATHLDERTEELRRASAAAKVAGRGLKSLAALTGAMLRDARDGRAGDLVDVERRLVQCEAKAMRCALEEMTPMELAEARAEAARALAPYRRRMDPGSLARREELHVRVRALNAIGVRRLSLWA